MFRNLSARAALVLCFALFGCAGQADDEARAPESDDVESHSQESPADAEQLALEKADPVGDYGRGLELDEAMTVSEVLAHPDELEGRSVQVAGTVAEVCPRRGCWIELAGQDEGETLRVKVTDGEIVFPLSAKGHPATVEGVVERIELTEEQHRAWKEHEAEERGEPFDPSTVEGALTTWRLRGEGARIGS